MNAKIQDSTQRSLITESGNKKQITTNLGICESYSLKFYIYKSLNAHSFPEVEMIRTIFR